MEKKNNSKHRIQQKSKHLVPSHPVIDYTFICYVCSTRDVIRRKSANSIRTIYSSRGSFRFFPPHTNLHGKPVVCSEFLSVERARKHYITLYTPEYVQRILQYFIIEIRFFIFRYCCRLFDKYIYIHLFGYVVLWLGDVFL